MCLLTLKFVDILVLMDLWGLKNAGKIRPEVFDPDLCTLEGLLLKARIHFTQDGSKLTTPKSSSGLTVFPTTRLFYDFLKSS